MFERKGVRKLLPRSKRLAVNNFPFPFIPPRKTGIALVGMEHPRQVELVAQGQRLGIDLRPSDDEDLLFRRKSASASSSECTTSHPSIEIFCRVTTTLRRPGSGRPNDS